MQTEEARARFAASQVARLATVGADLLPHLVAVCFALDGDRIVTAIDHKPKRTTQLRRLRNIRANPNVCLLADYYDADDWTALWWARADGTARILEPDAPDAATAISLLVERYPQYRAERPAGPVIEIAVTNWSGWSASPRA